MRTALKWTAAIFGALMVLLVLAFLGLSLSVNARLNRSYTLEPQTISIPSDAASLAEGQRLASIYCAGCHGDDYAGAGFFNTPALAVIDAPNLTSGAGGAGAQYSDADWVRAIRHGIDPDGRPLLIMPSGDFYHFNDEDLGQIIAYLKTVPPVDRPSRPPAVTLIGRSMIGLGAFGDTISAERIPHNQRPPDVAPAVDAAYGQYLVNTFGCATCHGPALTGGKDPNPDAPPAPDLSPSGNLGAWQANDFIQVVRARRSEFMPFESLAKMSDDELTAIFLYLQTLPAAGQ